MEKIYKDAVLPALSMLPQRMRSAEAIVMLLAIGLQESRLIHRRQIGGPARGLLQFERGGGVMGVLKFHSTAALAKEVCNKRGVLPYAAEVYHQLEHDDVLAMAFGRLLLWTDPKALPCVGDVEGAWDLYMRTWRPGKPHRKTWDALYTKAAAFVGETA